MTCWSVSCVFEGDCCVVAKVLLQEDIGMVTLEDASIINI